MVELVYLSLLQVSGEQLGFMTKMQLRLWDQKLRAELDDVGFHLIRLLDGALLDAVLASDARKGVATDDGVDDGFFFGWF